MLLKTALPFTTLDLDEDIELKEIINQAADICNTPIALINFFDEKTQHLKLSKGFEMTAASRSDTFSHYTIQQSDIMIVPDAFKDDRFKDDKLLIELEFRFYAGMPLISSEGERIGVLCVVGHQPGNLTNQQISLFKIIAKQASKIIELKLRADEMNAVMKEMEAQQDFINNASIRLRSFFESSTNFHVLLGKNGEVIDFNKTAFGFVKNAHQTDMKRGDLFVTYVAPEFVSIFIEKFHLALQGQTYIEEGSTNYGELGIIWWDANFEPAYNDKNEIVGISYIIRNTTERKTKEQKILDQNQSLLKIAHIQAHEFRAPLTTIMGVMGLIKDENYNASPAYFEYLEQAIENLDAKIKSIVVDIESSVVK